MEGEGTSQAELFTGWSSVVHQPCEEPEERDLPSTVDIAAFTNLNVEQTANSSNLNDDSDSETDSSNSSEASSHSDSSESDSSTSSTSRSSSPQPKPQQPASNKEEESEFAVTSSQTSSSGLKLTIAKRHQNDESSDDSDSKHSVSYDKGNLKKSVNKKPAKIVKAKKEAANNKSSRPKTRSCTSKKMESTDDSSDGAGGDESAAMLASCSLQEIRQEDLAAILPDQEADAFGSAKRSPDDAEDCSDSDMELPHQAVDALIQRTTGGSSSESEHELPNPPTLYANSLLQQFEAQTQMLSTKLDNKISANKDEKQVSHAENGGVGGGSKEKSRRRGRSKKIMARKPIIEVNGNSPDSGIQNSPDHVSSSPEPIKRNVRKNKTIKSVTSDDRHFYGNSERTLYPPRRRNNNNNNSTNKKEEKQSSCSVKKDSGATNHSAASSKSKIVKNSKSSFLYEICERVSKSLELAKKPNNCHKQNHNHQNAKVVKVVALKASKVMHSKKRRDVHKKRKFKILKPPSMINARDPKLQSEIEKMALEFARLCTISSHTSTSLKRVSKKRKTSEYERKKKSSNNKSSNPEQNEQRLPLKKRHYHLTADEETLTTENKGGEKNISHIDEAIEACITKFSGNDGSKNIATPATTPKKRHKLNVDADNQVSAESSPEIPLKKVKVSIESVVSELKMKRCNLGGKLDQSKEIAAPSPSKYPACKRTKPVEQERLDAITAENPTGIFMPSVEIETDEKLKIKIKSDEDKTVAPTVGDSRITPSNSVGVGGTVRKVRKRRAPNRTGFPTVKKKKKKTASNKDTSVNNEAVQVSIVKPEITDRVPADGEEYANFVSRTSDEIPPPPEDDAPSDCESLPIEERTNFELAEFKIRLETASPTTSLDTDKDLDEIPIDKRLELKKPKSVRRSAAANASNKRKPRWKKRYLTAGLFSDHFKEGDTASNCNLDNENVTKNNNKMAYSPLEHPQGLLPPPIHCGRNMRKREVDFKLPYDLWWQHLNSQLSGRDVVPSWNYRKIRTNFYNNLVRNNTANAAAARELQTCNCSPSDGCGEDCINRLVLSECPANIHKCGNQKIQRHEWAPGLEKFMTRDKGWGVRTKLPIKSNEFILEYVGEVVTEQEFKERMAGIYANDTHHYCLHLDSGMVIDGHRMGGDGRFVNHSCEPNCEMQKWSVNGQFRMALFALRDIEAHEELTYDYNFSLYDPAEGQECKCNSKFCRGVIGGKTQRIKQRNENVKNVNNNNVNMSSSNSKENNLNGNLGSSSGRAGRPRKVAAVAKKTNSDGNQSQNSTSGEIYQLKPISHQMKCFIIEHHCFLLRNIEKVRRVKDKSTSTSSSTVAPPPPSGENHHRTTFLNHLNALQKPRNMKTRTIAQVEDDPDLNRSIKFASVLKNIFNSVVNYKGDDGNVLAAPLLTLPSKRKTPELYQSISDPIDFTTVEQKIEKGAYRSSVPFDDDMNRVFRTIVKFYGQSSEQGIAATVLKKIYTESKRESSVKFEEVLGTKQPSIFSKRDTSAEEDIIRCICGMYHDEGLMIQCERCFVWQHCECIGADPAAPSYHCEKCVPREVDYEIPTDEFTEHGHKYYMTLMRGDLQLRQGDTVYVLRDINVPGTDKKHTYETIGNQVDYNDLDIFRIERLWKDSKTGKRMAYGHHYLRPHETYHEPKRKFFSNEVMRVPLYEAVPVELIVQRCWVLDPNTFCKGRPIDADEKHVYICENRVDKLARVFHKISNRSKYPICTKSYVFERFPERLRVSRTYAPHELEQQQRKEGGATEELGNVRIKSKRITSSSSSQFEENCKSGCITAVGVQQTKVKDLGEQKSRLNKILLKLLEKIPAKEAVDASYLLEGVGGRRRKNKITTAASK